MTTISKKTKKAQQPTPKKVTIATTWDTETGILEIAWKDGEKSSFNLSELGQSVVNNLLYFGLAQRLQNSWVSAKGSPELAREKAVAVWGKLRNGDLGLGRGDRSHYSITVEAIASLMGIPVEAAGERWRALPPDKKRQVGNRSDVLAKISEIKAQANRPAESLASLFE